MSLLRRTTLGDTGVEVSSIGLGTWAVGGPYYTDGEPTGWSGDRSGVRESLTIASKVGFESTSDLSPFTSDNIRHQLHTSLKNLGTSWIDIYYLHHCDFGPDDAFLEEAAATFRELKEAGQIRAIGLSGYGADEILRVARTLKPDVIQTWADIEHDEILRNTEIRGLLAENHCGFVAMMPFGQGRLLGKHRSDSPPTFGDGDNRLDNFAFTEPSLRELEPRLEQLAETFGDSTPDRIRVALGYLLADELVTSVIPGFRNSRQVGELVDAARSDFDLDDRRIVEDIFPREEMTPHPWAE